MSSPVPVAVEVVAMDMDVKQPEPLLVQISDPDPMDGDDDELVQRRRGRPRSTVLSLHSGGGDDDSKSSPDSDNESKNSSVNDDDDDDDEKDPRPRRKRAKKGEPTQKQLAAEAKAKERERKVARDLLIAAEKTKRAEIASEKAREKRAHELRMQELKNAGKMAVIQSVAQESDQRRLERLAKQSADAEEKERREQMTSFDKKLQMEEMDVIVYPDTTINVQGEFSHDNLVAKDVHAGSSSFSCIESFDYWWLVIPLECFSANSKGFMDMKFKTYRNIAVIYMKMLQMMLHTRVVALHKCGERSHLVQLLYSLVPGKKRSDDKFKEPEFVARIYRLRVPVEYDMGGIVQSTLKVNQERIHKSKMSGVVQYKLGDGLIAPVVSYNGGYLYMTIDEWKRCCRVVYSMPSYEEVNDIGQHGFPVESDLSSKNAYYSPVCAGSLENILRHMKAIKDPYPVDPDYIECHNYIYCFPVPKKEYNEERLKLVYGNDEATDRIQEEIKRDDMEYAEYCASPESAFEPRCHPEEEMASQEELYTCPAFRRAYIWPEDGKYAWLITDKEYDANNFRRYYFPEIGRGRDDIHSDEMIMYVNSRADSKIISYPTNSPNVIEDTMSPMERYASFAREADPLKARKEYEDTIARNISGTFGFGLPDMIQMYRDNVIRYTEKGVDPLDIQVKGIRDFIRCLWHQDAILPPSNKAVIAFLRNRISDYGNLSMPLIKKAPYHNISPYANYMTTMAIYLEKDGTNSGHVSILMMWLSACGVSMGHTLQNNVLMAGLQSTSKSWRIEYVLKRLLIEGTYELLAYMTMKSYTGIGEDPKDPCRHLIHDQMVIGQDEAPPAAIGVAFGDKSNKSGDQSEAIAIRKTQLSSGTLNYSALSSTGGQLNTRVTVHNKVPCININLLGTNDLLANVNQAIGARMYMTYETALERVLKGGMLNVMTQSKTKAVSADIMLFYDNCKIKQALMITLSKLLLCKILLPITEDMGVAWALRILSIAEKKGCMNTKEARWFMRMLNLAKIHCMHEALFLAFDSQWSRIKDLPWDDKFWKLVEPYLYLKQEHITLAFGMLEQQYENTVYNTVAHAVYRMIKENDIIRFNHGVVGENRRLLDTYGSVVRDYFLARSEKDTSDEVVVRFLTSHHMMAMPILDASKHGSVGSLPDRIHRIRSMLKTSKKMSENYMEQVIEDNLSAMLDLGKREIIWIGVNFLAIKKRETDDKPVSKLREAVQEALQHRHALKRDLLYGRPWSDDAPFLFDVISICKGTPDDPVMKMRNPVYSEKILSDISAHSSAASDEWGYMNEDGSFVPLNGLVEDDHAPYYGEYKSGQMEYESDEKVQNTHTAVNNSEFIELASCGDDYAADLRASQLGLNRAEKCVHSPCYKASDQLAKHYNEYEGNGLRPYPQGFRELHPELAIIQSDARKGGSVSTKDVVNVNAAAKYKEMYIDPVEKNRKKQAKNKNNNNNNDDGVVIGKEFNPGGYARPGEKLRNERKAKLAENIGTNKSDMVDVLFDRERQLRDYCFDPQPIEVTKEPIYLSSMREEDGTVQPLDDLYEARNEYKRRKLMAEEAAKQKEREETKEYKMQQMEAEAVRQRELSIGIASDNSS